MDVKGDLTNEKKYKKFKSQFDLVNYAINLAESMIQSGKETDDLDGQNITLDILYDIDMREDPLKDLIAEQSLKETAPEITKSPVQEKFKYSNDREKSKKFTL